MEQLQDHPTRTRILDAALKIVRQKGFGATRIDDLCAEAGVTKGAFFHHFHDKEAMGIAAARHWSAMTGGFFATAPYHQPEAPLDRVLAYVDFRIAILQGAPADFTCFAGTTLQEMHEASPAIRAACADAIFSHAATLVPDIAAAKAAHCPDADWSPTSLAEFMQAGLQGAFILAKGTGKAETAVAMTQHLRRYIALLFGLAPTAPQEGQPS
jgi:TetR/AcrR family transcriptional regulator, transcriptional repressor for nem operon